MHDVRLIAKRNFEIVDFFGESHPVMPGESMNGKYLGMSRGKRTYSIKLCGSNESLYTEDFMKEYFEIERVVN